jgi:hypothetical protein
MEEMNYNWFSRPISVRITTEDDDGRPEYVHGYVLGFAVETPDGHWSDAIIIYLMDNGRQILSPEFIVWDA